MQTVSHGSSEKVETQPVPRSFCTKTRGAWGWELWLSLALTVLVSGFHLARIRWAGGCWRDEAATAYLANHFSVGYVIGSCQHELFPMFFPACLRLWTTLAGNSDYALRIFGALVGMGIVAALWWNLWTWRRTVPLVSLALLGFNATFNCWGDELRAYGLGSLSMLFTVGLIWRAVERPSSWRMALAMLAGVVAVQCLFNNSILLLALCLAGALLHWRRHRLDRAGLMLCIGVPAAISLVPYLTPLGRVGQWSMLERAPFGFAHFCGVFGEAAGSSGVWNLVVWLGLILMTIGAGAASLFPQNRFGLKREQRDLLFFLGTALFLGLGGFLFLLQVVSFPTQVWYYVPLLAFTSVLLDVALDAVSHLRWASVGRVMIALAVAVTSLYLTWEGLKVRQTNLDLVAAKLKKVAAKEDLIVVAPWYCGISFSRYYDGVTPWVTVPGIEFYGFHRYDMVKTQMMAADQSEPVRPILDRINTTLSGGHRVWMVGLEHVPLSGEAAPSLAAAPNEQYGWQDGPYYMVWLSNVAVHLRASTLQAKDVPLENGQPVNLFENPPLKVFDNSL